MHTFGADYFILSDIIYLFLSSICFFKISSKKARRSPFAMPYWHLLHLFQIRIFMILQITL